MHFPILLTILVFCVNGMHATGILYPRPSESRETLSLDGIWKFAIANRSEQNKGFEEKWYQAALQHVSLIIHMNICQNADAVERFAFSK
jgi:beta-glucuronidase